VLRNVGGYRAPTPDCGEGSRAWAPGEIRELSRADADAVLAVHRGQIVEVVPPVKEREENNG